MNLIYKDKKTIYEIESLINNMRKIVNPILKGNEKGMFISNDNFISMVRLLDDFESKIDLVYIDPPFNTNSTFHYNETLTSTISSSKTDPIAYTDSMFMDDYLEFIRERLILIKKLLSDKGTLYLHIDYKIGHYIKILLDEIFGIDNYINDISRIKSNPKNFQRKAFGNEKDMILVYSKVPKNNIFNDIKIKLNAEELIKSFNKIDSDGRRYTTVPCHAPGETVNGCTGNKWRDMLPPKGRHWRCSPEELEAMAQNGLIEWSKNNVPRIKKYADDHKGKKIQDVWKNYKDPQRPIYPTEKNIDMLTMIIEQSSNENSIIMDSFCGSSSFLKAGLKKNRYVIGIDKSHISKELFKKNKNLNTLKLIE
ncbi:site-specific DNA-methyltransferase [[Clostridium] colinum]|uniref:site-specific DNA-methyltransferase n=1 Tax=[Clostridium] colinum TaxID=36835 RepID=UPI002024E0A4|nr:site-specific DNA-methyltransferase [[Clostridium] colinum]